MNFRKQLGLFVAAACLASAGPVTSLTGSLDPANSNDIFVFEFSVANTVSVSFQSYGYGGTSATATGMNAAGQIIAAGGFDTYLSLFDGVGPTATFDSSNDDGICPPAATDGGNCFDSRLTALSLQPGLYTLILSVTNNFSIAENYGFGTLGDGFTGLAPIDFYDGGTGMDRTPNWALDISTGEGSITALPEPSAYALGITGLLFIAIGKFRQKPEESETLNAL
jgi:hypothetical protein